MDVLEQEAAAIQRKWSIVHPSNPGVIFVLNKTPLKHLFPINRSLFHKRAPLI